MGTDVKMGSFKQKVHIKQQLCWDCDLFDFFGDAIFQKKMAGIAFNGEWTGVLLKT